MSMRHLWHIQGDTLIEFDFGVYLGIGPMIRLLSYDLVRGVNERQIVILC